MASLNKYIYDTRGALRNYNIVADDTLSDRQIEFWIISQRATWLRKRDRSFITKDHSVRQTLVDNVISIDRSFMPEIVPAEYRILRTKNRLPKLINFESWDGIISTGPVDMGAPRYNHSEYDRAVVSGNGRFNKSQIFTFQHDGYVYLISKSVTSKWQYITSIAITGIWEDPSELGKFNHVNGTPCWTRDMEYPLSIELWSYMKEQIIKSNIDILTRIPIDGSNDNNSTKIDQP